MNRLDEVNVYFNRRLILVWEGVHTLHPLSLMTSDSHTIGHCPDCGERITSAWGLVEYEKSDGSDGVWAECPGCGDVVSPE